ncbi:hypothetical protein P175DRAFT_0515691 [Aspergillus ochraceoroseus IBT 24754]|uniref:MIP transporter n=3 Tax=Aspergillus subgen. Nidulantes TaxID=2720870 RepID=A0A0F8U3R3_9EURO|nr:uncharacterized protein P175DRAFT_0515691 [Aspergillus ochraceoroseus IBT 24754]KKK14379.1 hypothetical protein ARAM_000091 [Aspergillus rambellii]KKK25588.1 hypothetical protein AOCH_000096 [Aspergillus ochraceoroseus]PTU21569.1 hypothetical protein P175DRAFT_0515691 [Aspergillus ochraceoroseus IBT 24754]
MADREPTRPRARSEATRVRDEDATLARNTSTRSARAAAGAYEYSSPTRQAVAADSEGLQRRSTGLSRRSHSGGIPSLTGRTSLAERTQGNFTLAGPEGTAQLRLAQEPFVHPGYAELNPSYEQAANARPVWSLAKPLPRVVRPGMVPTKEELLQSRANAQIPAEQSQKMGLDVDPNELEEGRIEKSADPRKMAAQVQDARVQRENNFLNKILTGDVTPARLSRTSSGRVRRRSTVGGAAPPELTTVQESGRPSDPTEERIGLPPPLEHLSDEPLQPVPEEPSEPDTAVLGDRLDAFPEFPDATYPEDLHPLVQDLVEDEIHNNHTTWSVIRTHHREALAESLGVYVQLTIGFCADLSVTLANSGNPNTTGWAWGLATMMGIYISGGVSGAHLNPAVTCMLWFFRGFPKRKMPEYFAAQFLGAFIAGLTAYGLYYDSIQQYLNFTANASKTDVINCFVTSQRNAWITPATAFFNEFVGTLLLAVTILALGDDQNAPPGAGMNALIVGLVIYCLIITFAYQTGAAFNPSRDFGPRLALLALGYGGELFRNPYWFYGPWAGTVSGAFVGGFLYDFLIFTGGESPVNYPLERTRRAMRKSRMKWRRRLHLAKKEVEKPLA